MMQWMTYGFSPFWGWFMFLGMLIISVFVIIALVLFIVWIIKQLKK